MVYRFARATVLAAGVSIAATAAHATPVLISQQESDVFASNGRAAVKITDDVARPTRARVHAGGFALTSAALGDFLAWCLDISTALRLSSNYHVDEDAPGLIPFPNTTPYDLGRKADVQALFDTAFSGLDLTSNEDSAGFQLALWEVIYEDTGTFDVNTGDFNAYGSAGVRDRANEILGGIDGPTTQKYRLTFLESADTRGKRKYQKSQNLVTVSPIPLPAAGVLLLGALGGLGLMRRRKKT